MSMTNIEKLEARLWDAADQLRANSKLTAPQYSMPVLGLIFLRHAYNRYLVVKAEIEKSLPKRGGVARTITKDDFVKRSALYLQEESQFEYLLNLKGDTDIGQAIIKAMDLIEQDCEGLKGILPKEYQIFDDELLTRLLKIFNDESLQFASGDVFGRIYEYFLMKFDMQGGLPGEVFTPPCLVQLIVNVIEPDHGIVFDPACGSGGMFVQSSHFIEGKGRAPHEAVTFYGQEKTSTTIRLAKMNLAVHGLEGSIKEGNTFYEDQHDLLGKCDFVMANPPFNVDGVDAEKVKTDPRLPFGLPGINKKKAVSNGNYLWISYFHSYLCDKGRAGFVMSSQASSAGHGEKDVRRKLIETGDVDVMIAIRSKFFYTRPVPCELWHFDKNKPEDRQDKILMIDAKNIYHVVTRKVYDFTPEQLQNLTAIVWLYRGETDRFLALVKQYLESALAELMKTVSEVDAFRKGCLALTEETRTFVKTQKEDSPLLGSAKELSEAFNAFHSDAKALVESTAQFKDDWAANMPSKLKDQKDAAANLEPIAVACKELVKQIDLVFKLAGKLIETLGRTPAPASAKGDANGRDSGLAVRENGRPSLKEAKRKLKELDAMRKAAVDQLKQAAYFQKQAHWLQSRFPDAKFVDVEGLCKLVDRAEIEAKDWSLNPGRYVGVAPEEEDDDFDFEEALREIHVELADLNQEAVEMAAKIQKNFEELGI